MTQPVELVPSAHHQHGVNYFFAYSPDDDEYGGFLDGLAELCADPAVRADIFIAVSECSMGMGRIGRGGGGGGLI